MVTDGPYNLPDGWRWVNLGEVCAINPPRRRRRVPAETPAVFVPMAAVDEERGEVVQHQVRPYSEVSRGYTYFEEGDILFAKITPCMENGKSAIAKGLPNGYGFGSTEFHVIRPSELLLGEWIWLFVRRWAFRQAAARCFRGGVGQQRVPPDFVGEALLPLPPIEEQRRIVSRTEELMERVREAKRLCKEARAEADRLWHSVLAHTFPHPGSALPEGWRWVKLGEVCLPSERRNPAMDPSAPFIYVDIATVNNRTGTIESPKQILGADAPSRARNAVRAEDVILATTRPNLRNVALVPSELDGAICSTGFCVIRANRWCVAPRFLFNACRSAHFTDQLTRKVRGASYPAVTDEDVRQALLPLPPLSEQQRIVAYLDALHERLHALDARQEETEMRLNEMEQSVLDSAFRGAL